MTQSISSPLPQQNSFLQQLLPNLSAGIVAGIFTAVHAVSFAAMIFSGELSEYVGIGIGFALLNAIILSLTIGCLSSYPVALSSPKSTVAAILGLMATAMISAMPETATPEDKLLTVVAAIMLNSICCGVVFFCLGHLKLGRLIRYIPYPVLGGFLAGSSWLLLQGAWNLIVDIPLDLAHGRELLRPHYLAEWGVAVCFAIALWVMLKRFQVFWMMPTMLLLAIACFHLGLFCEHLSILDAQTTGFLLGPFQSGRLFQPIMWAAFTKANWSVIFANSSNLVIICLINVVALLLNSTSIELVAEHELDLNHELKIAGIATLTSGLGGGIGGFHSFKLSSLAFFLGGNSRVVACSLAFFCGVLLLIGAPILSFFPKPILGGMLIYIALELVIEWVYYAWFRLSRFDYAIVLAMLVVIIMQGFIVGILVGLALAILKFVLNCSQLQVIQTINSRQPSMSKVRRSPDEEHCLHQHRDNIQVFQLQGLLFFGTANQLLVKIREHLETLTPQPRYVVLDCQAVQYIDASAIMTFAKLRQIAKDQDWQLLFVHCSEELQHRLKVIGCGHPEDEICWLFPDLSAGVTWCEDCLLKQLHPIKQTPTDILAQLTQSLGDASFAQRLSKSLKCQYLEPGTSLFESGDPIDGIYWLTSGQITVTQPPKEGQALDLCRYCAGHFIGAAELYQQTPHKTTAIADQPSEVYWLTNLELQHIESQDPDLASQLHKLIAKTLSFQINQSN